MTGIDVMQCGCPEDDHHQLGCWLGEAEAIAQEAVDAARVFTPPRHGLVTALTALAEAGHLREPTDPSQVLGVLDALTELELLGPAEDGA